METNRPAELSIRDAVDKAIAKLLQTWGMKWLDAGGNVPPCSRPEADFEFLVHLRAELEQWHPGVEVWDLLKRLPADYKNMVDYILETHSDSVADCKQHHLDSCAADGVVADMLKEARG